MACFHPLKIWHCINADERIKNLSRQDLEPLYGLPTRQIADGVETLLDYRVYAHNAKIYVYRQDTVPCGACIGCRIRRAQEWTIRNYHESTLYKKNCFLTLTYNSENLPEDGSISKRPLQLFFKRLRKRFPFDSPRYFACGEYGTNFSRPHYHVLLFNFDFEDKKLFTVQKGIRYSISKDLAALWPFGFHLIGDVTPESCGYVSRYVTKKITGEKAEDYYKGRQPEFTLMSRRPGIGYDWFQKFYTDVYNIDSCILPGNKSYRPPRYYDNLEKKIDEEFFNLIRLSRQREAQNNPDNIPERLDVKEKLTLKRFARLSRKYENLEDSDISLCGSRLVRGPRALPV